MRLLSLFVLFLASCERNMPDRSALVDAAKDADLERQTQQAVDGFHLSLAYTDAANLFLNNMPDAWLNQYRDCPVTILTRDGVEYRGECQGKHGSPPVANEVFGSITVRGSGPLPESVSFHDYEEREKTTDWENRSILNGSIDIYHLDVSTFRFSIDLLKINTSCAGRFCAETTTVIKYLGRMQIERRDASGFPVAAIFSGSGTYVNDEGRTQIETIDQRFDHAVCADKAVSGTLRGTSAGHTVELIHDNACEQSATWTLDGDPKGRTSVGGSPLWYFVSFPQRSL